MSLKRKYENLSNGELSKKEEEFYQEINLKKDLLLKILEEVELINSEIELINKEWNARE